jgi:hypothetical protein
MPAWHVEMDPDGTLFKDRSDQEWNVDPDEVVRIIQRPDPAAKEYGLIGADGAGSGWSSSRSGSERPRRHLDACRTPPNVTEEMNGVFPRVPRASAR